MSTNPYCAACDRVASQQITDKYRGEEVPVCWDHYVEAFGGEVPVDV